MQALRYLFFSDVANLPISRIAFLSPIAILPKLLETSFLRVNEFLLDFSSDSSLSIAVLVPISTSPMLTIMEFLSSDRYLLIDLAFSE